MGREIERKFLPAHDQWSAEKFIRQAQLTQGYLVENEQWILRVRLMEQSMPQAARRGFLTLKGNPPDQLGPAWHGHAEFEYPIPPEDAQQLLATTNLKLQKERRWIEFAGQVFEVDIFTSGLVLIELELADPAQKIIAPPWLGPEVTGDVRYTNRYLAEHEAGKELVKA